MLGGDGSSCFNSGNLQEIFSDGYEKCKAAADRVNAQWGYSHGHALGTPQPAQAEAGGWLSHCRVRNKKKNN